MPRGYEFKKTIKTCRHCGTKLELNNTRDIKRKNYCSRSCCTIHSHKIGKFHYWPNGMSEKTRIRMSLSRQVLCVMGWKPVGWRKYNLQPRISGRGYYFKGTKRLHTILAEKKIGRRLLPNEVVHHKNEDKLDNSLDNLEVLSRSEHIKLHLERRKKCLVDMKIA